MKTQSSIVYRHEYKYLLDAPTAIQLYQELSLFMQPDTFSTKGAYRVKSLYFDSFDQRDYYEKMDGMQTRKKIRIRIYHEDDSFAKLELKAKEENGQYKSSIRISKKDAITISNGDYSPIFSYDTDKAYQIYTMMVTGNYSPSVLIEYDRYAFIYPEFDTRITFDHHIKATETDFRLFHNPNLYQPILNDQVVLEVKFNQHLMAFIQEILAKYSLNNISVSKYCNSRLLYI